MAECTQENTSTARREVVHGWGQLYDLTEFIQAYNLPPLEARPLFQQHGPSREALDAAMKARTSCI